MENNKKWPIFYYYLFIGIGVSNLGNWIYMIALNVFVWHLTNSAAAVAGIYIVGPFTRIICNFFVGSIIDRRNKKTIVVMADIFRGLFVCLMPFAQSVGTIYFLLIVTNIATSFFGPSSTALISSLVKTEDRLRFNSILSTLSSGAFMIGPALGGIIIKFSSISMAMWVNSFTFIICALFLQLLPYIATSKIKEEKRLFQTLKEDYQLVYNYAKEIPIFSKFLLLYSIALMIAFALDSQEVTFLLSILSISDDLYGITVTVAGIGAVVGGIVATAFATKYSISSYIKVGFFLTLVSYLIFYSSPSYLVAVISFITLGFFMAFSNSGYATYYQESIPVNIMGRFTSIVNLIQSALQVLFTMIIGFLADIFSLQLVTISFAMIGVIISIGICKLKIEMKLVGKE